MKMCQICGRAFKNEAGLSGHSVHCPDKIQRAKILISSKSLCSFGCGRRSRYVLKNGKICCSQSVNSCPEMKIRNGKNKKGIRPNWKSGYSKGMTGKDAWNKGRTYIDLLGEKAAKDRKERVSKSLTGNPNIGFGKTAEIENVRRDKIRRKINERYENGWMPKAGRCKKIRYSSSVCGDVLLDGSWELIFAKFLDNSGVVWNRNKIRFPYFFEGRWRHYTPDFYIDSMSIFVEVKGYITDKDKAKWIQFPTDLRLVPVGKDVIWKIKKGVFRIDEIKEACPEW